MYNVRYESEETAEQKLKRYEYVLNAQASRYLQTDKSDLLDFRALAASGQSFTAGFKIGCKIRARAKRIMQSVLLQ